MLTFCKQSKSDRTFKVIKRILISWFQNKILFAGMRL
ncbi:hypothetical protein ACYX78_16050 [Advenella incenata]